ncbi:MAG: hypothetical protein KF897_08325 [Opitutaceae bacterium]|nr:hypothetical protein [Opitutaceae bacterium]
MNLKATSRLREFQRDFADFEKSLRAQRRRGRRSFILTPERMVVELRLSEAKISRLERRYGLRLAVLTTVCRAFKKHGLFPRSRIDWEQWLLIYQQRKSSQSQRRQK